jgi:hypothetical protein
MQNSEPQNPNAGSESINEFGTTRNLAIFYLPSTMICPKMSNTMILQFFIEKSKSASKKDNQIFRFKRTISYVSATTPVSYEDYVIW